MEYYTTVHQALAQQLGSSSVQRLLAKSLFAIVIGSNDIFDYSEKSELQKKYTPHQYVNLMATTLKLQLKVRTNLELKPAVLNFEWLSLNTPLAVPTLCVSNINLEMVSFSCAETVRLWCT